jgi:plastocyanin
VNVGHDDRATLGVKKAIRSTLAAVLLVVTTACGDDVDDGTPAVETETDDHHCPDHQGHPGKVENVNTPSQDFDEGTVFCVKAGPNASGIIDDWEGGTYTTPEEWHPQGRAPIDISYYVIYDVGTTEDTGVATAELVISGFAFSGPGTVPAGTTVIVQNTDDDQHTWTSVDDLFDSGALRPGDTFSFTFDEPGEYDYFCRLHPSMTGTIVVTG